MNDQVAPRPLFIIGNKRSGSTHFMSVLNQHPEIFVSNESDIVWILHQFHRGLPLERYHWDTDVGMQRTLAKHRDLLDASKSPMENFIRVQLAVMQDPSGRHAVEKDPAKIRWLGDQKPFQQCDPELLPFILESFPGARFLHLVRHPFPVVHSCATFKGGDLWKGMGYEELLERWTMHERWVEEARTRYPIEVLDVRYEDLVNDLRGTLIKIWRFLEVEPCAAALDRAAAKTKWELKYHPRLDCSPETLAIMQKYNYRPRAWLLENLGLVKNINRILEKLPWSK
jgi:hypothetical protein